MSTETTLLPCPFCAGEASIEEWEDGESEFSVGCNDAGCLGHETLECRFETPEIATNTWNRRALQPKVVAKPIEWVTQTAEGPWYSTNLKHRIVKIEVGFEWQQKLPKPALEKWEPMFSLETFESIEAFINEYQQLEVNRAIEDCDIVITPTQKHA